MLGFGLATLTLLLSRQAMLPPPPQQQQLLQCAGGSLESDSGALQPASAAPSSENLVREPHDLQPEGVCQCTAPDKAAADGGALDNHTVAALHGVTAGDYVKAKPQLTAAQGSAWQSTVRPLAAGASALMLLWALGQRGLVVRSGHDAMWRITAEHRTVLPPDAAMTMQTGQAGGSSVAGAVAEYLPLAVLPWALLRAKHRMLALGR